MSGSRKALKVVSVLLIIYAVAMAAFGIFMVAGGSFLVGETVDVDGTAQAANVMAAALGAGTIAGGVIDLIIGLLGLRGAKNPRKVGPFFVLCIIGLVLGLVSLGMSIAQGSFNPWSLVSLVIIAVCLYLSAQVKKQA